MGPVHTFNGNRQANFYISSSESSNNPNLTPEIDANYFCKSIYGFNFKSFCHERGNYDMSGKMGEQVHRGVSSKNAYLGSWIDNSNCNGRACKIWKTSTNYEGLYDILCQGNLMLNVLFKLKLF